MHTKSREDPPLRTVDGYLSGKAQVFWPGSLVYIEGEGDAKRWTLTRPSVEAEGLGSYPRQAHSGLMALVALERTKYPPLHPTCTACNMKFKISSAERIAVEKMGAPMPVMCKPCVVSKKNMKGGS